MNLDCCLKVEAAVGIDRENSRSMLGLPIVQECAFYGWMMHKYCYVYVMTLRRRMLLGGMV